MVRKWIGPMMKRAARKGTVGIFKRKAKSMGVSTRTLARRWYGKAGIWGKRARAASHMMASRKPRRAARRRATKRTTRTRRKQS